jgi:hypothetical protein
VGQLGSRRRRAEEGGFSPRGTDTALSLRSQGALGARVEPVGTNFGTSYNWFTVGGDLVNTAERVEMYTDECVRV